MVIDSVDTTVHNHRLPVYIERDPVRLFDFMFDVLDTPTRCNLGRLMFGKGLEATHRLF